MSAGPARGDVWRVLGAPTDQEGSVNEPRVREQFGARWNEKWIYRVNGGQRVTRVVLWLRYDLAGIFRIGDDGDATPESFPDSPSVG